MFLGMGFLQAKKMKHYGYILHKSGFGCNLTAERAHNRVRITLFRLPQRNEIC